MAANLRFPDDLGSSAPLATRLAAAQVEIGSLRERITSLERESMVDPLTGAWNRRYIDAALANEARRSRRHRLPLAVAILDIDHFKAVNDRHGHLCGDAVLRDLAGVLLASRRASDLVARWGGEEFVIVMPSSSHATAAAAAERLRCELAAHPFREVGRVTASVGVAELLADEAPQELLARADVALYRAKMGGRNRVETEARGASEAWSKEDACGIVKLDWHESYASGDPVIDSEHRELFACANALLAMSLGTETERADLLAAMDRCFAHIAAHFTHEEQILAERGYARLESHRVAHRVLLARARALRRAAAAGGEGGGVGALVEFLAYEVVARHMLTADRDFFPVLAA
jgi:diguanylate cyclase (GGDEF)-like protein/hemerythrin-like metal-binding protein